MDRPVHRRTAALDRPERADEGLHVLQKAAEGHDSMESTKAAADSDLG